jgi:hypothetical protein
MLQRSSRVREGRSSPTPFLPSTSELPVRLGPALLVMLHKEFKNHPRGRPCMCGSDAMCVGVFLSPLPPDLPVRPGPAFVVIAPNEFERFGRTDPRGRESVCGDPEAVMWQEAPRARRPAIAHVEAPSAEVQVPGRSAGVDERQHHRAVDRCRRSGAWTREWCRHDHRHAWRRQRDPTDPYRDRLPGILDRRLRRSPVRSLGRFPAWRVLRPRRGILGWRSVADRFDADGSWRELHQVKRRRR